MEESKIGEKGIYEYEAEAYLGSSQALPFEIIFSFATLTVYLTNSESMAHPICNIKRLGASLLD